MGRSPVITVLTLVLGLTCMLGLLASPNIRINDYVITALLLLFAALVWTVRSSGEPSTLTEERAADGLSAPPDESESVSADDEAGELAHHWSGTARVWPTGPDDVLRLYPVHIALETEPTQVRLLNKRERSDRGSVVAVDLLEHDCDAGHLDLRVTVDAAGRRESHIAKLVLRSGFLVSEDDSETFTLDLKPAGAPVHHAFPV